MKMRGTRLARLAGAAALTAAVIAQGAASAQAKPPPLQLGPNVPAQRPPGVPLVSSGLATIHSLNWSGYVVGNNSELFKSVASTYVQPAVACPVSGAFTVFWVGFDGWYDGTVEQDGTGAYCNGSTPEYFAWWEMYPTNSIQYWFPISAGDTVAASVKYKNGEYLMSVKDKTSGVHNKLKQLCASGQTCSRTSAEWVIERPGYGGTNFAPLANWGTTSLGSDKAASSGGAQPISAFPRFEVDMVSNDETHELATVGALGNKGHSFPDTWDAVN